jgi:alcohol dehydrogenase class IV
MNVDFISANKSVCRVGAAQDIASYCQSLGISRPLLVTDAGLVKASGRHVFCRANERANRKSNERENRRANSTMY